MSDNLARMYELAYPRPTIDSDGDQGGPLLVVGLQGYADAGNAIRMSTAHLLQSLEHATLATFTVDEFIDYRSRRPATILADGAVADVEEIELSLKVVRDLDGRSFLLLSGLEPDLRWEAFSRVVSHFVDTYQVSGVLCLYSAAMNVPHTRPLMVTGHGNSPELLGQADRLDASVTIPGAAQLSLEYRLGKEGTAVGGLTAHVPHYLGAGDYPAATLGLLESLGQATQLRLPLEVLRADAERAMEQIHRQLSEHNELSGMIGQLEQQFDEEVTRRSAARELEQAARSVPSADELGDMVEDFLAGLDESGDERPGTED